MVAQLLSPSPAAPKLTALRSHLQARDLDLYLIPSADEHLNEYLPEAKQRRSWLSGFTGSAGDALVGRDRAWVFVDSRYYEQADLELDGSLFISCKQGLPEQQSLEEVLVELAGQVRNLRLGFDPFTLSLAQDQALRKQLEPLGVVFVPVLENLVDQIRQQSAWADSLPVVTHAPVFPLAVEITGLGIEDKLQQVRQKLEPQNVDVLPVTKLDQIAWLFNLRGSDIPYNPVFIAYAIVTRDQAYLFTWGDRLTPEAHQSLADRVEILPYEDYASTLQQLAASGRVLVDPKRSSAGTYALVKTAQAKTAEAKTTQNLQSVGITQADNPIEVLKALKNDTELDQMRRANLWASRAKTLTIQWLQEQIRLGTRLTEAVVADTVERFYAEQPGFQGLSFNTICGSGANSSIVHYGVPDAETPLTPGGFVLLDSGAQYLGGTTDDTRTLAFGPPSPQQVQRYTEVLKAHINCAMQRFPKGTTGAQLDGLTRANLWHAGLDFGHGVGHGVGAFLNVHEGPNGISKRSHGALQPGMVTSVEPGFYEPNWGGIRLENLYITRLVPPSPASSPASSPSASPNSAADSKATPDAAIPWYEFESLTYIPFDPALIDLTLLDLRQQQWLQRYCAQVVEKLTPLLTPDQALWLEGYCQQVWQS
jgi:Xaa-Pro aminopeptidase